jgi:hypothetical protein
MLVGSFDRRPVRGTQKMTTSATKRRNPPWTYDELVLAFDPYVRRGLPNVGDLEVVELSSFLNDLRTADGHASSSTLRNPNGVHLKLCNFRAKDQPGRGNGTRQPDRLSAALGYHRGFAYQSFSVLSAEVAERGRRVRNWAFVGLSRVLTACQRGGPDAIRPWILGRTSRNGRPGWRPGLRSCRACR